MAKIELNKVCVDFPIYTTGSSRSLKNRLVQVATGGKLGTDVAGRIVVRALNDLNFTLHDGDRVALLGHNGAGKSTLLRVLNQVYEPSTGAVQVTGEIGSLIDISLGIDPEATGRENIYIRGGLLGMKRKQITHHLEEIIEFSQLGEFIDMPLRTYSAGMHMRLAFTVSTVVKPNILLMDEWLSVGDEDFQQKAEVRMKNLVKASNILVIATHSKELILKMCNRVIWIEHGEVKLDGNPEQIVDLYFNEQIIVNEE